MCGFIREMGTWRGMRPELGVRKLSVPFYRSTPLELFQLPSRIPSVPPSIPPPL